MSFPWYDVVESSSKLNQGDLIKACPILIPPSKINLESGMSIDVKVIKYNVIILSQSCDLVNGKLSTALVCPYITFQDYVNSANLKGAGSIEGHFANLRKGLQPSYHLLDKDIKKGLKDYLVVDFRNVSSVDVNFLTEFATEQEQRIRLQPPYREQLSQAFAKFFMRVGLPQDIEDIKGRDYIPV